MFGTRQIAESSSRKRSKPISEKSEKFSRLKDETSEGKEARREERRAKKQEREARKAAEAAAILGISRVKSVKAEKDKGKGKEKEMPKREKKPKVKVDEVVDELQTRKSVVVIKKKSDPKREVRSKNLAHDSHREDIGLNNSKDSPATTQKHGSESRRHHHHDHPSAQSEAACARCIRRQRRKEEKEARMGEKTGIVAMAERSERTSRGRERQEKVEYILESIEPNSQGNIEMEHHRIERQSKSRSIVPRAKSAQPPSSLTSLSTPQRQMSTARQGERILPKMTERVSVRQPEREMLRNTERLTRRPERHVESHLRRPENVLIKPESIRSRMPIRQNSTRNALPANSGRVPTSENRGNTLKPDLEFAIKTTLDKLIECVSCLDDEIPAKEAAKLNCDHWFCNECLKRLFALSLTDPAHMPPKCCTSDHIPLKHVDKLLSHQNKKLWNKKYLEYTTANRIYCPTTDCGEWIQPKDINFGIGKCQKCKNKVCATCNGPEHGEGDCPEDPDLLKFFEAAEKHKYQKCYNCKAMVELERGCNHMTCHCTAQFCYVCGSKWKTCGCPWFNYEAGEAEREYVVPDWNVREPTPVEGAPEDEDPEDLARDYYELPSALQIDPLAALGTITLGLRNGLRRLAADYVELGRLDPTTRPQHERRGAGPIPSADTATARQYNEDHDQMRPNVRGLLNTGPGLGLGLRTNRASAFYGAATRGTPAVVPQSTNVQAGPAWDSPLVQPEARRPLAGLMQVQTAHRSNFLTDSQQANVERYLEAVDLEDPEPAVEAPFQTAPEPIGLTPAPVTVPTLRSTPQRSLSVASQAEYEAQRTRRRELDTAPSGSGRRGLGLGGIGLRAFDVLQLVGVGEKQ